MMQIIKSIIIGINLKSILIVAALHSLLDSLQTSVFTPAHGTVTTVRVETINTTQEVIQLLLDKFKV